MIEKIEDSEEKGELAKFKRQITKLRKVIDNANSRIIPLRIRNWAISFRLSKTKRELRGEQAENIIRAYLNGLGMHVEPREKKCQDMVAVDPSTKNRVPVQVKSVSLKRHGWEIRVDAVPLRQFTGFYIVLFEHEPEDIILHIESGELQRLMGENGKTKDGYHHKNRKGRYVPASLKDFEQYISSDKFKDAVFGKREANKR